MAHFAELDSKNKVIRVIVIDNNDILKNGIESESLGKKVCKKLSNKKWIQTSYNNNFRKQYAGIGYTYNEEKDIFISPNPFLSWKLNDDNDWTCPVKKPIVDLQLFRIYWNENKQQWITTVRNDS
jgi:hypothetical protein